MKFYVGIQGAVRGSPGDSKPCGVVTGRWGCGVFGGDETLKFCIQWLICSFVGVSMTFHTNSEESQRELRGLVRHMGHLTCF